MKQVWFHYTQCEEYAPDGGMWRIVSGAAQREEFIEAAASLMRDRAMFKQAMCRAIDLWPNSCAMNLTSQATNHRAWFGHAGCYLHTGSPEDCTRLGWHRLNEIEQRIANAAADEAIAAWKEAYTPEPEVSVAISLFGQTA